ncbi:MAG TPA: hypothetical protein DCP92_13860 [Nitrospiraceae bacterium]|jgi:hypothetical protein|nr:hypothetical protein [Nitrospiraceae bacterium]
MDRMKKLIETLRVLIQEEFNGHIRINFSQGSIGRVEKSEEFDDTTFVSAAAKNKGKGREEKCL